MNIRTLLLIAVLLALPCGTAALAACVNPPGIAGDQFYNADHKHMQFCDGDAWHSMRGAAAVLPFCAAGDGIVMSSAGWACSPGGPP